MRVLVLLALAVLLSGNAYGAGFKTGNALLEECEDQSPSGFFFCYGYLQGVADSVVHNLEVFPMESSLEYYDHNEVCFPHDVIAKQLAKVWVKWANENPQDLNLTATSLVLSAFADAWPCTP